MQVHEAVPSTMVAGAGNFARSKRSRGGSEQRPLPAEFCDMASRMSQDRLAREFRTSRKVVRRWLGQAGLAPATPQPVGYPVPTDFALEAPDSFVAALARRYGVSDKVVLRWAAVTGVQIGEAPGTPKGQLRPIPADFIQAAPSRTMQQLMTLYRAGDNTVRRWIRETGVPAKQSRSHFSPTQKFPPVPAAGITQAAQAAQYLRRSHSNIFRCEILSAAERSKLPNGGRGHWSVAGKGVLSDAELITLAEKKGFDAQAWARI